METYRQTHHGTYPGLATSSTEPSSLVWKYLVAPFAWVKWWLSQKIQTLVHSKERVCNLLQNDKQALWNLLSLSFSKKMDYLAALVYPTDFLQASEDFDNLVWSHPSSDQHGWRL